MDDKFVPPYLSSNYELPLDQGVTPPDMALRLLEAEHLLRLHEYVEDALAGATNMEAGGLAFLRVLGETFGAESAHLKFYDSTTGNLSWPAGESMDTDATGASARIDHVNWSHSGNDATRVRLEVPIGTSTQPIGCLTLNVRMAHDPSEQLLDTLKALGLR